MNHLLRGIIENADQRIAELDQFLDGEPPSLTPAPMQRDRARLMWKSIWAWIRRAELLIGYHDRDREDGGPGLAGLFAPWAKIEGRSVGTLLPHCDERLVRRCNAGFAYLIRPTSPHKEDTLWDDPVSVWSVMNDAAEVAFCNVLQTAVAIRQMVVNAIITLRQMNSINTTGVTVCDVIAAISGSVGNPEQTVTSHWLTKEEVALRLGISQRKVDRMAADQMFSKHKLGTSQRSAVRFDAREIERFMEKGV